MCKDSFSALRRIAGGLILLIAGHPVEAQSVADHAVRVSAAVQTNLPRIELSWLADPAASGYTLYRKTRDATSWGSGTALAGSATNYVDTNVSVGGTYEYRVSKAAPGYSGEGYLFAGIEAPMVEERGKLVLIVDENQAASLAAELARLERDLVGDGWLVIRHDVTRGDSVTNIKALITTDYSADPGNVRAVFLLGHVPVPYSGKLAPDGHFDHVGAWPADCYYVDMDGTWTDASVTSTDASDPRNRNVPGDGKFDQTEIPSETELQIGRVDLSNLPAFTESETELLRQYLNKNHTFRHGRLTVDRRGLIDDHLGVDGGQAYAVNGWRNFAPLVGTGSSVAGDWLTTLASQSHLWGYGCGGGTYTSCSGVASSTQLTTSDPQVVFTMFFGSYFGDWDTSNNFLRAALATPRFTLASVWAGRPHWQFHHMGLGETIGFSTRLTQNNYFLYSGNLFVHYVHIALMGDPTLRLHPVLPVQAVTVTTNGDQTVKISWFPSPDGVAGYAVYGASDLAGPFGRLNEELIEGTNYIDSAATSSVYMVRAVKLEVTPSGSYFDPSQGVFQDLAGSFGPPRLAIHSVAESVILSWPTGMADYQLESTPSVLPSNWFDVTNAVHTSNGLNSVHWERSDTQRFFRLR